MKRSRLPLLTSIPNRLHAFRRWFKTDHARAIDRHIDYFGGAGDPFAGRANGAGDGAPLEAPTARSSITRIEDSEPGATILSVEGRLVAESVQTLANEWRRSLDRTPRLRLDVSGVTFIDGRGDGLLRDLRSSCREILDCPSFVEGLLSGPHDR